MKPRILLLTLALLLPGCRGPAFPYELRPPSAGPRYFATQDVVFHLPGGGTERVLTVVENDGEHLSIVASSPLGQTLFVLKVQDGRVDLDARVPLPSAFDPRLLATLIELSDWPLEEARKGLPPGTELQEAGPVRTLLRRGRPQLILTREGPAPPYRVITLRFPQQGLDAVITTLED